MWNDNSTKILVCGIALMVIFTRCMNLHFPHQRNEESIIWVWGAYMVKEFGNRDVVHGTSKILESMRPDILNFRGQRKWERKLSYGLNFFLKRSLDLKSENPDFESGFTLQLTGFVILGKFLKFLNLQREKYYF